MNEIEPELPDGPPRQAPPAASWSLMHQRFVGMELALGPDGSIYVAGADANRLTVGGRPVLWLAKLSAWGEQLWGKTLAVPMVRLPGGLHPRESIDLTIAVSGSTVNVVTQRPWGAPEEFPLSMLRRFSARDGKLLDRSTLFPRIYALRVDARGELIAAGHRSIPDRNSSYESFWFGGLAGTKLAWQQEVGGEGTALDIAAPSAGAYVVIGSRSDDIGSDAWVWSGTADGRWSWNAVPLTRGEAVSLCEAQDGDVIVAGPEFVARFDAQGELQWTRRLDAELTVVHCLPEGYLLGFAARRQSTRRAICVEGTPAEYLAMRVELRGWDHTLLWQLEDRACQAVQDLKSTGRALFVLKNCNQKFGLTRYDLSSDLDAN